MIKDFTLVPIFIVEKVFIFLKKLSIIAVDFKDEIMIGDRKGFPAIVYLLSSLLLFLFMFNLVISGILSVVIWAIFFSSFFKTLLVVEICVSIIPYISWAYLFIKNFLIGLKDISNYIKESFHYWKLDRERSKNIGE